MDPVDPARLEAAYQTALAALLAERTPEGHWVGELSSSALSTATAISALALVQKHIPPGDQHQSLIDAGLAWLAANENPDGGWGDTTKSLSNISTTMLCRAALHLTGAAERFAHVLQKAEGWLFSKYGSTPHELAEAVRARYGKDRTFAVPILTTCALAGLVPWSEVPPLPFELACLPQSWFRFLRLHVVSYALPALIAIGQCVYYQRAPRNPLTRLVRRLAVAKSLRVLRAIQPSSGGYLEATPLTSFVTLSLASIGQAQHPVAVDAVKFLVHSARPDGSWAIDSNLATWVTTLAVNALAAAGEIENVDRKEPLREWLLQQQHRERHPYTGAKPGGWAWTPLPGGVSDGDDTPGALLSLIVTAAEKPNWVQQHANAYAILDLTRSNECLNENRDSWLLKGSYWLARLQNRDGGWPTFCRGWGHLPFDRSGPDLTAHSLRTLASVHMWLCEEAPSKYGHPWGTAHLYWREVRAGLKYLARSQRPDGSWLPLWFGDQHAPNDENPTYGTARVLAAYRDLGMMDSEPARKGIAWLVANQNDDGGWGGCRGTPSSIEETALAVEILLDSGLPLSGMVNNALPWLVGQIEAGGLANLTPIGFYFAKLWYFEKLYPIIFSVAALGRARRKLNDAKPEKTA